MGKLLDNIANVIFLSRKKFSQNFLKTFSQKDFLWGENGQAYFSSNSMPKYSSVC